MRVLLTAFLFFLSACASTRQSVDGVRSGMDKDRVLQVAGNPKRTYRSNSQDHWIYVDFIKDEEFSRVVTFEDGKVIKVGRAQSKQSWSLELENMKKESGFKTIDGGAEDVNEP